MLHAPPFDHNRSYFAVLPLLLFWVASAFVVQADAERALSGVVTETERGPVITFTVEDHDLVMTVEEVGKISSAAFQRLYSVCCLPASSRLPACRQQSGKSHSCNEQKHLLCMHQDLIQILFAHAVLLATLCKAVLCSIGRKTPFHMQTYARKLGACLLELSDSESSSAAAEDMHRWITELTSLTICVSLGNPKGLKAFHSASMDGSSATVNQLPDSFYEDLLVGPCSTSGVRLQQESEHGTKLSL